MTTAWYQHMQPCAWTACSKEPALMAQCLICAGGFWLSHCSMTSLSLTVNTGLSAATAVLLAQSAFTPAQMLESLPNPCSSKHGHSLATLMAPFRLSQSRDTKISPDRSRQAHQHTFYLDCSQHKDGDSSCRAGWPAVWECDTSKSRSENACI